MAESPKDFNILHRTHTCQNACFRFKHKIRSLLPLDILAGTWRNWGASVPPLWPLVTFPRCLSQSFPVASRSIDSRGAHPVRCILGVEKIGLLLPRTVETGAPRKIWAKAGQSFLFDCLLKQTLLLLSFQGTGILLAIPRPATDFHSFECTRGLPLRLPKTRILIFC